MSTLRVNTLQNTSTTDGGISIDNSGHVTVDGVAMPSSGPLSNRNLVINGAMQVAQRGTSGNSSNNSGNAYLALDRWKTGNQNGGAWTMTKSTDTPSGQGFASSTKWECTSSASATTFQFSSIDQYFEGQDLQQIKKGTSNAEQLTLSFWVKASTAGTYIVFLRDFDNSRICSRSYTVDSADTWEKKTITYPADTTGAFDNDNALSLSVAFWFLAGSGYSSGTLQTTWGAYANANVAVGCDSLAVTGRYVYLTGVQLEVGSVATPFEHRSYGDELQRCIRYFRKHQSIIASAGVYTDTVMTTITFDPPMRTGPSVDVTGPIQITAPGVANYNQSSAGITQSNYKTAHGIFFYLPNYSGLTNHRTYILNDSADTILFDAEL